MGEGVLFRVQGKLLSRAASVVTCSNQSSESVEVVRLSILSRIASFGTQTVLCTMAKEDVTLCAAHMR